MSTKTTFKRVALVAVAALGFGVLSSVTPASAGVAASFSLNTSSITVVGGSATDTPSALVRIKVTGDTTGVQNVGSLSAGETITAKVTGVPTGVTAKTSAANGGAFGTASANDLSMVEVKGQTSGTLTSFGYTAAGDGTPGLAATTPDTVTATTAAPFDGAIGSENTSFFGQVMAAASYTPSETVTSKVRYYYVAIMPKLGATVRDQGVYTVSFTLTDLAGNLVSTQTLKIDFVTSKVDSGSKLTLTKGGTYTVGTALTSASASASSDLYTYATLTNRDGGVIRGKAGAAESLTTTLRLADATSDTGSVSSSDAGTSDFGNVTDLNLIPNDGVFGIQWNAANAPGAAGTYTLTAKHGSASATATYLVYAASGAYTATAAAAVTGSIGSTPSYTAPLTTKSAVVTVTVLSGSTAVQDYPVTFTTTWTSCAAGDATPVSGVDGSTVVKTNSSGKATLTVTCASPADGTIASVAFVAGGTAGTSQVITWAKSKPATVSVSPGGPMTVALKAVTTATFTVTDAFGAPVAGEVVNLTVTGSNNTVASPLLIPSATTDAKGQVSYTLTDALAIAAGTDAIKATTVTGGITKTLTLTYATTVPVPATMKVYVDPSEATWTTLVPATTIYESGTTGYVLNQGKNIAKSLAPTSASASDDVIGFNALVETAALAAASGLPVSVSISDGGWILSSAGLPGPTRTFYTSSTGYTGLIYVTATTPGTKTITFTVGTVTSTATLAFTNGTNGSTGRFVAVTAGTANASAVASGNSYPSFTAKVTDGLGNAVAGATLNIVATGVGRLATGGKTAQWTTDATGSYTFELVSTEEGAATVTVTATNSGAQHSDIVGYIGATPQSNTALAAGIKSATGTVTFAAGQSATDVAQTATDAAAEATDAANAATDAANAAAEAADAATAAAQDAADAVAALSTQVSEMVNALKKQITALTNLVIKIQKKVKA
jgi:hypothetical protein